MIIGIIDYGINNISSVAKALMKLNIQYEILTTAESIAQFQHLILPGVGSFEEGVNNLNKKDIKNAICQQVQKGSFLLGICLGMQLLFDSSEECKDKSLLGLGLIPGRCHLLPTFPESNIRIPHIGWNEVKISSSSLIYNEVPDETNFYFVHSFHAIPQDSGNISGVARHGIDFVASVLHGNIFGTQFHPEKSGVHGMNILAKFASLR